MIQLAVVTTGSIAEDRRQRTDSSGPRVPDVVAGVDVSEQHEPGRDLSDPLAQRTAAHKLDLVVMVVGRIEDAVRRTVRDKNIYPFRDVIPDPVDGAAVLHVGPVTVAWRERRAPETETVDLPFLIDEQVDSTMLDQVTRDEALLQ